MEALLEKFKNNLKENGYKLTIQRQKILDVIIKNQYKHLTSEEIYMLTKRDSPEIGLSTVYRTMQLLMESEIVCEFDCNEDGIRYELMEPDDNRQHPHLICNECGKTFPIENTMLNSIETQIYNKYDFKVINCNFKFYGICKACRK